MSDLKEQTKHSKEPNFIWTDDLIAEFAREVAMQYKNSEMWSSDLHCEKQMLKEFVKSKQFEKLNEGLVISYTEKSLIVDKPKFDELIKFLYNYKTE